MQEISFSQPARWLVIIALFAVFVGAWIQYPSHQVAGFAGSPVNEGGQGSDDALVPEAPVYNSRFVSSDLDDFVHASSIAALPNGDLISVWFAGSREGAADVQVRAAYFDANQDRWGEEQVLATRPSTQDALNKYVRKVGNPTVTLAPDNRLWVFYVSVSIGGWAGSAVNAMYSDDLGQTWSSPRQLVTTPFFNISTLVRGAPIFHEDGSIGLPVYHEFLGKFAEYLYLSPEGEVLDKFRISHGSFSLQPTVVPLGRQKAIALLRYAGDTYHRVLVSRTSDAGQTWSAPQPVDPANPNSSLAAVGTPDRDVLVALNDLEEGRFRLRLMGADESLSSWKTLADLDKSPDLEGDPLSPEAYKDAISEEFRRSSGPHRQNLLDEFLNHLDRRVCKSEGCFFEYEYPSFIRGQDGSYHLVYSWNNTFIKHVTFNDAWLETRL